MEHDGTMNANRSKCCAFSDGISGALNLLPSEYSMYSRLFGNRHASRIYSTCSLDRHRRDILAMRRLAAFVFGVFACAILGWNCFYIYRTEGTVMQELLAERLSRPKTHLSARTMNASEGAPGTPRIKANVTKPSGLPSPSVKVNATNFETSSHLAHICDQLSVVIIFDL